MSSDLRDLFRRELDEIPLRSREEWLPNVERTRRAASRSGLRRPGRTALVIAACVVLVVASISGGLLLADLRRQLGAVTSPKPALPTELLYLSAGDPLGATRLVAVSMPEGKIVGSFAAQTYIGGKYAGRPLRLGVERGLLPVVRDPARGEAPGVTLASIALDRAVAEGSADAGNEPFSTSRSVEPMTSGASHLDVAIGPDSTSAFVVRDGGTDGHETLVQHVSLEPAPRILASRRIVSDAESYVWSRAVPLDGAGVAVAQTYIASSLIVTQVWRFLDDDLRDLGTYRVDETSGIGSRACVLELTRIPATHDWLLVCTDPAGFANTVVVFLSSSFKEVARIELPRALGPVAGWSVTAAPDGVVTLVMNRMLLVRIGARTRSLIDERLVPGPVGAIYTGASLGGLLDVGNVVFSADGGTAYLADVGWRGLSRVDLDTATLTAYAGALQFAGMQAIQLSPDGARLHVLAREGDRFRLVTLDAVSLRELARTDYLPDGLGPFALLGVSAAR
ncbi:MAG: hypothetical protein E6I87_14140 [Chloroflexi bacterium]|nr:MAG: hypothetical protein E6I87_14140 [Chloroflexota bacterium]